MPEHDESNLQGTAALPIEECERRLAAGGVGILALAGVAAPVLRPVNFVLRKGAVILRTGEGRILEARIRRAGLLRDLRGRCASSIRAGASS